MSKSSDYILQRQKVRENNKELYKDIVKIYRFKCAICDWNIIPRKGMLKTPRQGGCHIHHIDPVNDGGTHTIDNLILLCPNCHALADYGMITKEILRTYHKTELPAGREWLKAEYKRLNYITV